PCRHAMQQPLKILANHRTTASAWRHDVFVRLEDFDEAFGQLAGFGLKAIVVERLAAAGLGLREGDGAAEMLEDFGDSDADVGIELIGEAGDKKRDVGVHVCGQMVGEEGGQVNECSGRCRKGAGSVSVEVEFLFSGRRASVECADAWGMSTSPLQPPENP